MKKIIFCALTLGIHAAFAAPSLLTTADSSQYKKTGRYDEVIQLCAQFQKSYPKLVRCFDFGITPEGRPMKALAVGRLTAQKAHAAHDPVLLIQGGIHAGEIDGKDASFWWLRDALEHKREELKHVTLVIVPVFNVDGHERFGAHNRPNQVGPEEMGWRTTAQNLNLNRDYMKAEAPEMQAMLGLLGVWDPIVYVDLHVTDGAEFQHSIALDFHPGHVLKKLNPTALNGLATALEDKMLVHLTEKGFMPLSFYPSFIKDDDPTSGFADALSTPRFSHPYWGWRNRIGLLVETHSWKDYATRVRSMYETIEALVTEASKDGKRWVAAAAEADRTMAQTAAGSSLVLRYKTTKKSHPFPFQGYSYKIEDSKVSGQKRITYDVTQKQAWTVPLFDELEAAKTVVLPKAGYLVEPARAEWVARKLKNHGIRFMVVQTPLQTDVEAFRAESVEFAAKSFEARQELKVTGDWKNEKRSFVKGALYIPMAQPAAGLIANLFEPASDDSLLSWGFFNSAFEQKEYMESYVTEVVAETMLKDPAIAEAFNLKLKEEAFAKSPEKRLEFFYRRHPSWDERYALYPVYRVATAPTHFK